MLSSLEAIGLELFIHESHSFKRFYDNYREMRCSEDRVHFARSHVTESSLDYHRGIHEETIFEVTRAIINYMEDEMDRIDKLPNTGSSK